MAKQTKHTQYKGCPKCQAVLAVVLELKNPKKPKVTLERTYQKWKEGTN